MDSLPFFLLLIMAFFWTKMNCKMMTIPNTVADSGYKPSMNGTHFDEQQDTKWSGNQNKIANYVGYKYKPLMDANQLDEQAIALWTDPQQQQSQSAVLHLDGATFKKTVLSPGKQVDYLVIFYSHTCPHCQSLAPELLAFAESVISQRDRAVVAVYNVNRPFNALYARQIKSYPTVIFFPKEATQFRDGRRVDGFGEMPREQMEAVFGQLLAGKFDLSESQDQLLELDASSFQPTIDSAVGRPQPLAFVVGFFNGKASDAWKTLAKQAHRWREIVRIAFVNCARNENRQNPCRQQMTAGNGQRLPVAKLIMQNDLMPMPYREDAEFLRSQLAHKLFELSHANPRALGRPLASNRFVSVKENHRSQFLGNFHDPFAPLLPILWPRVEHFLQVYLLMVIEHPTRNGNAEFASKLILALNHWHRFIHIVPIASTQPLASRVFAGAGAGTFPHIRLYRTDLAGPLLRESYGWKQKATSDLVAVNDVLRTTGLMEDDTKLYGSWMPQLECEKLFTRCRPLYFASETDMLKALREAVYDEVVTKHEHIRHKHRHHLLNFLYVLEQYLPDSTKTPRGGMKPLPRMQAAKRVFADLRRLLDKSGHVLAQQWEAALVSSERKHGNPFPTAETDWRHCRGFLLKNSRRFTCGMWTAFHVVTVNAFKKMGDAKSTLRAIQGWVDSFFGCEDCRSHFMEMTTQAMPIQYEVKHQSDVVLYLWRAHNHVNERLALEETNVQEKIMQRDVVFKKRHFPPKFLCPGCWNPAQTLNFLIDYYERIEPTDSPSQSWELKMAREDEGWIYKDHLNYVF